MTTKSPSLFYAIPPLPAQKGQIHLPQVTAPAQPWQRAPPGSFAGSSPNSAPLNRVLTKSKSCGVETIWVVSPMALTAPSTTAGGSVLDCAGTDLLAQQRWLGRDTHSGSEPLGRRSGCGTSRCNRTHQSTAPEPCRESRRDCCPRQPASHPTGFRLPHAPQPRRRFLPCKWG